MPHPQERTTLMLARQTPNRRIKILTGFKARYRELERSVGPLVPIVDVHTISPRHPFSHPSVIDPLETDEGVAAKGQPPTYWTTDIDPKSCTVETRDGVGSRWKRHPTEGRP
jgi:hypothetical protein